MKRQVLHPLLCSAGLLLGGAALAGESAPCGITTNVRADGTVELSNTGSTARCDAPAPVPAGKPAAAPAGASAAALPADKSPAADAKAAGGAAGQGAAASAGQAADAAPAPADPPKDPRQQYRDAMLEGAPGTTAANPSVSRRYKMMNKDTYQATILGGAPQEPATVPPASP